MASLSVLLLAALFLASGAQGVCMPPIPQVSPCAAFASLPAASYCWCAKELFIIGAVVYRSRGQAATAQDS